MSDRAVGPPEAGPGEGRAVASHRRVEPRSRPRRVAVLGVGGVGVLALGVLALVAGTGQAATPSARARGVASSPPAVVSQPGTGSPAGLVSQPGTASGPTMLSQSGSPTAEGDGQDRAPTPARQTPSRRPSASPTPSDGFTCGFSMNGQCYGGWWVGTP